MILKPYMVVKLYGATNENRCYVEVAEVTNGQLGSFHTMSDMDSIELGKAFGKTVLGNISYENRLFARKNRMELHGLTVQDGKLRMLEFTYQLSKAVKLHYNGMDTFTAKMPKMGVKIKGRDIYLYFVERVKGKDMLYNAFLPNVYASGQLCQGSTDLLSDIGNITVDINAFADKFMEKLFSNTFMHSNVTVGNSKLSLEEMATMLQDGSYRQQTNYYKPISHETKDDQ